jgi:hypothetical protein
MCWTHRRVYFKDLQNYKRTIEENRAKALDELAAEGRYQSHASVARWSPAALLQET